MDPTLVCLILHFPSSMKLVSQAPRCLVRCGGSWQMLYACPLARRVGSMPHVPLSWSVWMMLPVRPSAGEVGRCSMRALELAKLAAVAGMHL